MKKTFTNIVVVFMAVLVFYGGAGVNIISYCCNECRSAGIEALINDKCCEIHHHNHDDYDKHNHSLHSHDALASSNSNCSHTAHTEDNCCEPGHIESHNSRSEHSSGDSCNMERIDFDWSFQNIAELTFELSPDVYELFSNNIFISSSEQIPLIGEINTVLPNGPPLVLPRDYLSVLTILLI